MNDVLSHLTISTLACSVAIALVLAMRKAMTRQFGAQVAYALWALVPLASLATLLPARSIVVVVKAISASTQIVATTSADSVGSFVSASGFETGFDVAASLCGLWIAGVAASLVGFRWQHHRFVRTLGRIEPLTADLHRAEVTQGCPALVGIWRPRIVLPADFESRYSVAERELILAHERHHLARGDALINALSTLLRSVFWFNPLVYVATPRFIADQELACDAAVIARFSSARRIYANAMLKAQLGDSRAAWACHWSPRNLLRERIAMLARPATGCSRRRFGYVVAAAMTASGTAGAWASQPVETRTRYGSSAPIETAIADAVTKSIVSTPKPARNVVASSHEIAPRVGAATHSINSTPTAVGVAAKDSRPNPEATPIGRASAVAPKIDDNQSPREITSYRRDLAPKYPAAAVRAHIEGRVVLDVGVDANGNATDARVASLEPATATELASASLAAVTRWQFDPARHAGRTVAGRLAVPFVFALSGESAYAAPEAHRQASYRTVGSASYPNDLAGREGVVYVRVRIENDGTVSSSEIDHIDPPSATSLGASALSALGGWTFNPARDSGNAVASTVIVPIVFGASARSVPSIARIRNSLDPIRIAPKRI
jgi:TonB family protein